MEIGLNVLYIGAFLFYFAKQNALAAFFLARFLQNPYLCPRQILLLTF